MQRTMRDATLCMLFVKSNRKFCVLVCGKRSTLSSFILLRCCGGPDLQIMCLETLLISGQLLQGKGPGQDPRS